MRTTFNRRKFLLGTAAGIGAGALPWRAAWTQTAQPVRIGLLTVKTGPLAEGGIQMEQGITAFLKERDFTLAGRKVDLHRRPTPAATRRAPRPRPRNSSSATRSTSSSGRSPRSSCWRSPTMSSQHKMPTLSLAGADDMTQRKPNPYFVRASATSSQAMHPMGDYAAKEMSLKRVITIDRGFRLRLRADGRLPAGLRGRRRPGREEALAAPGDRRLHALSRADQRLRRRRPGLRRLEPAEIHEAIRGFRAQAAGLRRRDGGR